MTVAGTAAAAPTQQAGLESVMNELATIISAAQRAQAAIAQAESAAKTVDGLRAKIEELEAQNLEFAFKIRALEDENAELRAQLDGRSPNVDVDLLVKERDKALRKYERARKLLKKFMRSDEASGPSIRLTTVVDGGFVDYSIASGSSSARSQPPPQPVSRDVSDDESTIRSPRSTTGARRAIPMAAPVRQNPPRPTLPNPSGPVSSQETVASTSSAGNGNVSDAPSSASRAGGKVKVKKAWYLEFDKVPTSLQVLYGPIPFGVLSERLDLSPDLESDLADLETMSGYDIRIQCDTDLAFAFRPTVLEGPSGTYLIGWGSADMVKRVQNWSKTLGDVNLFVWPVGKDGWFYLGLHSVTFVELEPMWPKLPAEASDKQRLLAELAARNPGMDTKQFRKDVRAGKILQCCLELEGKGQYESMDFLREYGLIAGDPA
ncbi:hypothetical protein C8Q77DRAFT_1153656 [Trametes polyzona]|nr:hypothetical protein C8Q77DRAFT_1153656 [Trametes polyzona]